MPTLAEIRAAATEPPVTPRKREKLSPEQVRERHRLERARWKLENAPGNAKNVAWMKLWEEKYRSRWRVLITRNGGQKLYPVGAKLDGPVPTTYTTTLPLLLGDLAMQNVQR